MVSQLIELKNELLNAIVYVDYENIFELLKKYGVSPGEINFFPVVLDKFRNVYKLNVIECVVYCNFEKKPFQGREQTVLQNLGLQTRHAASNGKNCSDLMLTVDALSTLYKNPNINVFVIVSSDRDMIPLLKTIKYENKVTYILSTRYGFNPVVSEHADYHEYIEDMFNLTLNPFVNQEEPELDIVFRGRIFNPEEARIEDAQEVSKLLYSSNIWKKSETDGNPVTLKGYLQILLKKVGRASAQIEKDFALAHQLKYITIYKDENKGLCLKKGNNYSEIL
jgi:uncharacterized LabA/DUF88 family protein